MMLKSLAFYTIAGIVIAFIAQALGANLVIILLLSLLIPPIILLLIMILRYKGML